ncbi:MAG: WG repeat-containing protein [Bacteroidetes bacterium]|nr:WG repeat-containing protein [Bacteroidota bacterium]
MKISPLIFSILFAVSVAAQPILIPYRSGAKYGLSDEKGKLIVKPVYDHITHLKGKYFQYTNTVLRKDTVPRYDGGWNIRESREYDCGVFFKDKLLLKNKDYPHFFILPAFIIGSDNEFRPEYCELYNLKGETVIKGPVKSISINDERDFGEMASYNEQYTLISVFKRLESDIRTFSAAVYDNKAGKIVKWLLTDVRDYKLNKYVAGLSFALCTYKDQTGFHESYIRFDKNQYILQPKEEVKSGDLPSRSSDHGISREMGEPAMIPDEAVMVAEAPYNEGNNKSVSVTYRMDNNGQLNVSLSGEKKAVQLPAGSTIIFANGNNTSQERSMLIKKDKQFRILSKGILLETSYDTLLYLDKQFLAGKFINGKIRFGILDDDGTEKVPLQYDSIPGIIPELRSARIGDYNTLHDTLVLQTGSGASSYLKPAAYQRFLPNEILVYKDGKAGIVHRLTNTVLLPVSYDMVANNGLSFMNNFNTGYIILRKNGRYGICYLAYQSGKAIFDLVHLTDLVFDYIPGKYINDYYEVDGFRLFALYNDHFEFIGYADKEGHRFYN